MGEEAQGLHGLESGGREDIPDIFGHDVGDEEINFAGLVRVAPMAVAANVVPPPALALTQWADLICTRNRRPSTSTMKS